MIGNGACARKRLGYAARTAVQKFCAAVALLARRSYSPSASMMKPSAPLASAALAMSISPGVLEPYMYAQPKILSPAACASLMRVVVNCDQMDEPSPHLTVTHFMPLFLR